MKNLFHKTLLFAAALALVGAGCFTSAPAPAPAPQPAPAPAPAPGDGLQTLIPLGEKFTLAIGDSRTVQGGLSVTLEEIGDSRCKPNVQCIWAGELSPKLLVNLPNQEASAEEVMLGTTTKKEADAIGYHFSLAAATENDATIVVTK